MPDGTGVTILSEIRKINWEIPILVSSTFQNHQILLKAIKFNLNNYIVKPIQLNTRITSYNVCYTKLLRSYDDFTTPTFDDRHALIKGGSFISLGNEILRSARYAFRKHFFQHAGFRYVQSNNEYRIKLNDNVYETDEQISQYCEFHYGDEYYGVKNFPKATVEALKPYLKDIKKEKVLDLGCSVGRSSFELAKIFDEVLAIDFSANFINVGVKLKKYDNLTFKVATEGELFEEKTISLKDFDLDKIKDKVTFMQGDACNLKELYSGYDLIFCSNLIDRLYYSYNFV